MVNLAEKKIAILRPVSIGELITGSKPWIHAGLEDGLFNANQSSSGQGHSWSFGLKLTSGKRCSYLAEIFPPYDTETYADALGKEWCCNCLAQVQTRGDLGGTVENLKASWDRLFLNPACRHGGFLWQMQLFLCILHKYFPQICLLSSYHLEFMIKCKFDKGAINILNVSVTLLTVHRWGSV